MAKITVHWQHTPFSHDAGVRSLDDTSGTDADSVHTGVLTDEDQEASDGRPVLVEDETNRVYQAADLPPGTQVIVTNTTERVQAIVEGARRAGFEVAMAEKTY